MHVLQKPTAQAYYKGFAETKRVPVEWKLVRSKVRNMRVTYNKAKAWEGSTGAGSMEGETLKSNDPFIVVSQLGFHFKFVSIKTILCLQTL